MARAEAYLHAKFHLDPSNRLTTVHERHRQDRQSVQTDNRHRVNRFTNDSFFYIFLTQGRLGRGPIPIGILVHPAIWPQQIRTENWGLCPFGEGDLGPHLTHCGQGRGLHVPARQVSSWSIQPFGHYTPTLQTDEDRLDNGLIA